MFPALIVVESGGLMKHMSIDIETFSSASLKSSGVYRYAESPDFAILLFGYAVDNGEIQVVDLAMGEVIPADILAALTDDAVTKWAFNASFERVCLSKLLGLPTGQYLSPAAWRCSMVWSAYMGLPLSLAGAGKVLGLTEQKLSVGKDLIRYFCVPCKPTKANGMRERNLPKQAAEKWELFKSYNRRDVEAELSIQQRLANYPVPETVWDEYHLDQEINDRGILLDQQLVLAAIDLDAASKAQITAEMKKLTGLENPNSVMQLKKWLSDHGVDTDTLDKKAVAQLLEKAEPLLQRVLGLRQQLARSSVKKYQAMRDTACEDQRARGMFMFYGANRTGRFSGRHIQLQNLRRNSLPDLEAARSLVRQQDMEALRMLYEDVPDTLSQLVRTAFIPSKGHKFIVADFSAIECRVLAWLAGEQWVLDVFAAGGDIYCATAEKMFHKKVVKHGENGELRQKGKQAVLSCGYQGSVGALLAMGAVESGMKEEELQPLVDAWRKANPHIVDLWYAVDTATKECVTRHTTIETHGIRFLWQGGMMFIELPSRRRLAYVKPRMGKNRFGFAAVTYEGIGATKKWERLESFGGKFVENIVQAIARDVLLYAMQALRDYAIAAHVHDELIIETAPDVSVREICQKMSRTPSWAPGLLLDADGYACEFYKKD